MGLQMLESTSVKKGENLADTVRVVENYADVIALRHGLEGAAKLAAEFSKVPIINGGTGAEEHPTQAFTDLYTMRKEKGKIDGLKDCLNWGFAVWANSSLACLCAWHCTILSCILFRLKACVCAKMFLQTIKNKIPVTEDANLEAIMPQIDVLYVTRIQKERFPDAAEYAKVKGAYKIDLKTLKNAKKDMIIMHPLPRVDEIAPEVDNTPQARYFQQVLQWRRSADGAAFAGAWRCQISLG